MYLDQYECKTNWNQPLRNAPLYPKRIHTYKSFHRYAAHTYIDISGH